NKAFWIDWLSDHYGPVGAGPRARPFAAPLCLPTKKGQPPLVAPFLCENRETMNFSGLKIQGL
ncbi:MAG: hypothetical protein D6785_02790, partial [Planctomycetota bacterium]